MTHKEEICRWANSPDGTFVWVKVNGSNEWELTTIPDWNQNTIYIVNDRHAELRKQWIDAGKPTLQVIDKNGEWLTLKHESFWNVDKEYRIKPKEWYEDIPSQGILCWAWDDNPNYKTLKFIVRHESNEYIYRFIDSNMCIYKNAEPVTCNDLKKYIFEKN